MKYIISGGKGQIATAVSHYLQTRGHFVWTLSKYNLDITDDKQLSSIFTHPFDVFINCAAITNVDQSEAMPDKTFRTNAYALKLLGFLAQKNKVTPCSTFSISAKPT